MHFAHKHEVGKGSGLPLLLRVIFVGCLRNVLLDDPAFSQEAIDGPRKPLLQASL